MKVQITLFKTNFDEENVYVGHSKNDRHETLSNFSNEKKLILPISSFNVEFPFRIAKNYFEIARIYNYAEYNFIINEEIVNRRYYFIEDFNFINDNLTELIVSEDILADLFYDLEFERILPNTYTYKNSQTYNGRNTEQKNIGKNWTFFDFVDMGKKIKGTDNDYLGFLLVTTELPNESELYFSNKAEAYPIQNFLLPFCYTKHVINGKTSWDIDITKQAFSFDKSTSPSAVRLVPLSGFIKLAEQKNFRIISSCFITYSDIFSSFSCHTQRGALFQENVIVADAYTDTDVFSTLTTEDGFSFLVQKASGNTTKVFEIPNGELFLEENYKVIFRLFDKNIEIPINKIQNNKMLFSFSPIPPYNIRLAFSDGLSSENIFDDENAIIFSNDCSFLNFNDGFTEFLRNNFNSKVTGLEISQGLDKKNFLADTITRSFNAISNFKTGIENSVLSLLNLQVGTGLANANSTATNFQNKAVNIVSDIYKFSNNQNKERALLDLMLKDKEREKDIFTFSSTIFDIINTFSICGFYVFKNINFNESKKQRKIYGATAPIEIKNIKSHSIFDYISATDLTLKNSNFDEKTRYLIEKTFKNGVRIWYDFENYKNFDADNNEIE